jgi:hypothetical protein
MDRGGRIHVCAVIWALVLGSGGAACNGGDGDDGDGAGESGIPDPSTSAGTADATTGTPPGTSAASASTTADPDTTAGAQDSSGGGPIFDVAVDTEGVIPGECCGPADWSYIWIANSSQSTVSKINTRTMVEEGRYLTRDTPGNPSRTSVSVDGRAVAVANRFGGVVKIWTRPEDCPRTAA